MDHVNTQFFLLVLQIIWIDILLSGDNAVVIALACRSLPPKQRRLGIILGASTAVVLRIAFALIISYLLAIPYLRIIGGLLLLYIAVKLVKGGDEDEHEVRESDTLFKAVRTIAIADAVMSLDNVVAIAAASKGRAEVFALGLVVSIPLIVVGASVITALMSRLPLLVWAGAALLGWIAGEMVVADPFMARLLAGTGENGHYAAAVTGALIVMIVGYALQRMRRAPLDRPESAA